MSNESLLKHIKEGGVFAYPTETLWGLGADIYNKSAVDKIFAIKERQTSKAVSVLVRDVHEAKKLAVIEPEVEKLLFALWPGPITFVLPAQSSLPENLAPNGKVGLRCSSDPVLRRLLEQLPNPIITTSANKSGEPPALSVADLKWLGRDVLVYQEDRVLPQSEGSTVVLVEGKKVKCLRAGDLPLAELREHLELYGFELFE